MYSDLFDHLGSGAGASSSGNANSNESVLVKFKAGKMELTAQENGNYWAAPDTRRGEIRLVWKTNETALHWEWYDRREKTVDDSHVLFTAGSTVSDLGTMERVMDVPNAQPQDRLYVWKKPAASGSGSSPEYKMYWMQDASEENDDEVIAKVNQYLADPASANPSSSSTSAGGANSNNNNAQGASSSSTSSADRQQVDALSNILENLGMPQAGDSASSASSPAAAASGSSGGPSGTLTLADLQGAMAGLQQPSGGGAQGGPPLQELVTPAAINQLLENPDVKQKLISLLPEEQQTEAFLEENLKSPQVKQTLRSLTAALLPDDTGSLDGYHSVLANFNMSEHAQSALVNNSNNPIQAFLECVLKSVEAEKEGGDTKDDEGDKEE